MVDNFLFDVFLSHSSKDKAVVREIANRLRSDGVDVWFDEWILEPGDSIPAKIEEGLEHSRVLVLCMSANAFSSDWAQLEASTFRFRDPLNKERRFIPLRLDDAEIKGSLAQFLYVNWHPKKREQEYIKLLKTCQSPSRPTYNSGDEGENELKPYDFTAWNFSPNKNFALSGRGDGRIQLWSVKTKQCLHTWHRNEPELDLNNNDDLDENYEGGVWNLGWSPDGKFALSEYKDHSIQIWNIVTGRSVGLLIGHTQQINGITWSSDQNIVISSSHDGTIRFWDTRSMSCTKIIKQSDKGGSSGSTINGIAISHNHKMILNGCDDNTLRLWNADTEKCIRILEGHTKPIRTVSFSYGQKYALSGGGDGAVRLWDVNSGRCLNIFLEHTSYVWTIAWTCNDRLALSGGGDGKICVWDMQTGKCLLVHEIHCFLRCVTWDENESHILAADQNGQIYRWKLPESILSILSLEDREDREVSELTESSQLQYTNAKVLLVGESGAGKTGLSKRLALANWEPSDSTVGAWATQWKLPIKAKEGVEREIWLWDFGGQADQRLIHQLYMDETALAILVFDGQKEDIFETLGQWDRDLARASEKPFNKLLVLGRKDAGGLRVSHGEIDKFIQDRKFLHFLETSAKTNLGCEELKQTILDSINWDELPCRTTEVLFKKLKEEIIRLKDEGRVLMRFNELRNALQLRLSDEFQRFADVDLQAVITLLASPGVVWELKFGKWILLQPERINAYAQSVIRTIQSDEHNRGCLMEEKVLKGSLLYDSSMARLNEDEERFVLLAMHQTLVERGLCFRQPTQQGNLLIFPSYYRLERPEQVTFPSVLVNYIFSGFLDEIYATLIVRLHHSDVFSQDRLWRYAADFKTNGGKQLGVKLNRISPGVGDLEVYFDVAISDAEKIIFSKYIHEHLRQYANNVERSRHYICPHCGTPVGNRDVATKRLEKWLQDRQSNQPTIICVECENRVTLWDEIEECFASPETQQRVRNMQEAVTIELDNESKERALVGEVISTVALAGQLSREKTVSDHGIDMEIEFKDDNNEATGQMVLLQLKSGDSYLKKRKHDDSEIFTLKDVRHARYWMAQAFPVLLVIRNSKGEVRWMEIRDYLKKESDNGRKTIKQIIFTGERFDVMSVRQWREKMLSEKNWMSIC
jgi:small GTP-binding protein